MTILHYILTSLTASLSVVVSYWLFENALLQRIKRLEQKNIEMRKDYYILLGKVESLRIDNERTVKIDTIYQHGTRSTPRRLHETISVSYAEFTPVQEQ